MKFIQIKVFFSILLFLQSYYVFTEDEKTKKLGNFGNWSVYSKSQKLCYMIAEPEKSEGKYKVRGRVRIVVYRNSDKKENNNLVGFDFGYTFPENSKATIEIDTNKAFKLTTFGQTAWTGNKTKTDRQIINEMTNGNTLIAVGQSRRGTTTKDTYSLEGFTKAFEKITNYCG